MKRNGLILCMALVLVMALAACGQSGGGGGTTSPGATTPAGKATTAPAAPAAATKAPVATAAAPVTATKSMPAPGPSAGPAGTVLSTLKLADMPYRLAVSPSGEWIATVGFNAGVVLIRNKGGKMEVAQKTKDNLAPSSEGDVAVADDGTAVIGTGRTLYVIRPDKAEPAWSFTFQPDLPDKENGSAWADISADGKTILLVAGWKGAAAFGFRADKNTPLWEIPFTNFSTAAISPDGKWALVGNTPDTLLIDVEKGAVAKKYKVQANKKPSFSPDGGFFCGDTADTLAVVAVGADQPTIIHKIKKPINVGNMDSGGLSWGAQYAATTRGRKTGLEYYRAGTAEPVWQVEGMFLAALGADGRVAAVNEEGKVVAYDPAGKELWTYTSKGTGTTKLGCSSDFRFIALSRGTTVELLSGY